MRIGIVGLSEWRLRSTLCSSRGEAATRLTLTRQACFPSSNPQGFEQVKAIYVESPEKHFPAAKRRLHSPPSSHSQGFEQVQGNLRGVAGERLPPVSPPPPTGLTLTRQACFAARPPIRRALSRSRPSTWSPLTTTSLWRTTCSPPPSSSSARRCRRSTSPRSTPCEAGLQAWTGAVQGWRWWWGGGGWFGLRQVGMGLFMA